MQVGVDMMITKMQITKAWRDFKRLAVIVLLIPLALYHVAAYRYVTMHAGSTGKVEQVFADAGNAKQISMPVGWCTVEDLVYSTGGEYIRVYQFAKDKEFMGHKHIPHGADLSTTACDMDMHWCMDTAATADVKLRLSLWHLYDGRTLSGITTPDFVIDVTLSTLASDGAYYFDDALSLDSMDLTTWNTNRTVHDELAYKFERLGAAEGDTHGGNFQLMHGEIFWPSNGLASY
jgi:hypothetical protein